jgi:hypothetical protein
VCICIYIYIYIYIHTFMHTPAIANCFCIHEDVSNAFSDFLGGRGKLAFLF